jgi:hypothetical protein
MQNKTNYKKLFLCIFAVIAAISTLALTACDPSVTVNRQPAL